jgi:hypothetical protein
MKVNIEFLNSVASLMKHTDQQVADLLNPSHYGKTADGRIVVLDYGYDSKVMNMYYPSEDS